MNNPTSIKAAIDSGAWSVERIQIGDDFFYCDPNGGGAGVWDKSSDKNKDKLRKQTFDLIKAGTVNPDGSITTTRGNEKLVSEKGYARLVPATP